MNRHRCGVLLAVTGVLLAACTPALRGAEPLDEHKPTGGAGDLVATVKKLPVRPETDTDTYDRKAFRHWTDADHDGCDTRAEVLLEEAKLRPGRGADCRLTGGSWWSYYDHRRITDAGDLDIDHMVPIAEAAKSGASDWTQDQREAYANDLDHPHSLVAVTLHSNRSKQDKDPAQWLPPVRAEHCRYAREWAETKKIYRLAVDRAERAALLKIARNC
ncbi:HNH endonuclease family protein [Streptomyces nanshensis]|uniref:HNH endonuclease family protein n=1 Tax=Streptomyces nanshensis TaxID=518642 RepID=UPI00085BC404|nr:HNH endonuclease family protein [Streptomyces nanshensis]